MNLGCDPESIKPQIIFRDADWVWQAIMKQFEAETGLHVASVNDIVGHILGKEHEDQQFQLTKLSIELKGVEFEIDAEEILGNESDTFEDQGSTL